MEDTTNTQPEPDDQPVEDTRGVAVYDEAEQEQIRLWFTVRAEAALEQLRALGVNVEHINVERIAAACQHVVLNTNPGETYLVSELLLAASEANADARDELDAAQEQAGTGPDEDQRPDIELPPGASLN